MRLSDAPRRRLPLSLTPLIDVVFLLLIFFMLASTFLRFSAIPVTGAQGGGEASGLEELIIIKLEGGEALSINGAPTKVADRMARIDEMIAKGMTKAVVRPAEGASVQDLVRVLELARGSKLKSVVVVR